MTSGTFWPDCVLSDVPKTGKPFSGKLKCAFWAHPHKHGAPNGAFLAPNGAFRRLEILSAGNAWNMLAPYMVSRLTF